MFGPKVDGHFHPLINSTKLFYADYNKKSHARNNKKRLSVDSFFSFTQLLPGRTLLFPVPLKA
jgi:hypothetical protein